MTRYLSAEDMIADDFGDKFTNRVGEVVYDAKTVTGQWATMTERSFSLYGLGKIGTGYGQKYVRDELGHLNKVSG